jgi:hypothetical protein
MDQELKTRTRTKDSERTGAAFGRDPEAELVHYRTTSKAAVAGFIFALLGLLYLVGTALLLLPILGLSFSLIGLAKVRRLPDELKGRRLGRIGAFLSALVLVGGTAWHAWVYATEVRPGYERISFRMLKDDPSTPLLWNEQAERLDGKKIFVKGWVRPGNRSTNLKDFILVGDFGTCCFGGSPKISDVVAVSIQGDERVSFSWVPKKIHGVFRLNRQPAATGEKGVPRVFYQIEADSVE